MKETEQMKDKNPFKISDKEKQSLGLNAWHLARFVMEHDSVYIIPKNFPMGQFVVWAEKYPELTEEEEIEFIEQYLILEKLVKNVTARTLVATRIYGRGFLSATFGTSVGKYLLFLAIVALTFSYFLFFGNAIPGDNETLKPLFAAGLGTSIYLMRITQEKLKSREFDPANIPSHLLRLILGIVIGGIIIKIFPSLVNLSGSTVMANALSVSNSHGQELIIAIAFLLGYAVEIFYMFLDKIGGNISKRKSCRDSD